MALFIAIITIHHHQKSFWHVATPQHFVVGAANNTLVCQQDALPARYRCTTSLSTYTHTIHSVNSCSLQSYKIRDMLEYILLTFYANT
jgi:hypothetical protein